MKRALRFLAAYVGLLEVVGQSELRFGSWGERGGFKRFSQQDVLFAPKKNCGIAFRRWICWFVPQRYLS